MTFLHSLFSKLADAAKPAAKSAADSITHQSWNSMRTIVVLAFIGYLLYISKLLLTHENLVLVAQMIGLLVIANTLTNISTTLAKAWVTKAEVVQFSKDGAISAPEKELLSDKTVSGPTLP